MPRYKCIIEYDGTCFQGWQVQAQFPSVQGALSAAVFAFTQQDVTLHGAGRTDAGVHASGQVAHMDLKKDWSLLRLRDAMNAHLRAHPISILAVERVPDGFHARFDAVRRAYRYVILNRRAPPALGLNHVWHVKKPLDAMVMHRAAQQLIGQHDFTTFRNIRCQAKSPIKTLESISVHRDGELVIIDTASRSFLHNQVRSMVGSLKRVGEGFEDENWIGRILQAKDRTQCGTVAPAAGLTLIRVDYADTNSSTYSPSSLPSPFEKVLERVKGIEPQAPQA